MPGLRRLRRACCSGCLGLLAFAASSVASSEQIVLDHSIGPVSVLETRADVERGLGHGLPGKPNLRQHTLIVRYPKAALTVGYSSRTTMDRTHEQVVYVLTTAPRYKTASGVGVGSSGRAVGSVHGMSCYGTPPYACQHGMAPGKTGTAFAFRDGKVWRVVVGVSGIFG